VSSPEREPRVTRSDAYEVELLPWGSLVWKAAGRFGSSASLTLGRCVIEPGQANPRHRHPNCEELLEVLSGRIVHSYGERTVELCAGDLISIPPGVVHNARNVAAEPAELLICFSSGDRRTELVDE
jgi:quercetin dioxygenase-like cupin family protein